MTALAGVDAAFVSGALQVVAVNIVLSGDNAVVIALAARSLPKAQQTRAVVFGTVAAVVIRILLTVFTVELIRVAWLSLVSAVLLFWIAVQLMLPSHDENAPHAANATLLSVVRVILVADLIMSLDNVVGVAAAAHGNVWLIVLGLALSIPLVTFSSAALMRLLDRFPVIVTLGAALLGWEVGSLIVGDPGLAPWLGRLDRTVVRGIPLVTALLVVATGKLLAYRRTTGGGATSK
jgi:YjbE family integral membrane protein